jgi:hypothetical protein
VRGPDKSICRSASFWTWIVPRDCPMGPLIPENVTRCNDIKNDFFKPYPLTRTHIYP